MCSLAGEVQCSKEGEPFSEFLAQDEWWMEREKKLKGQARDHVFAGDHSLPIPLPPWLFVCLSLFLSFHPNPNNWSLQIQSRCHSFFLLQCSWPSCVWEGILLHGCLFTSFPVPDTLFKIFAYNKPFNILNNSEMYNKFFYLVNEETEAPNS